MGKSSAVTFTNVTSKAAVVSKDGQKVKVARGDDVELTVEREIQLADGNARLARADKATAKSVKERNERREHRSMQPGSKAFPAVDQGDTKAVTPSKADREADPGVAAPEESGTVTSKALTQSKGDAPAKDSADTGSGPVKGRTVPQLRALAAERGVTVTGKSGKKPVKADYVKALSSGK